MATWVRYGKQRAKKKKEYRGGLVSNVSYSLETRNLFDRRYRKEKRTYCRQQQEHIANLQSGDPKQLFWNPINKLDPDKSTNTSHGVTLSDG